jgi:hypothetical protein
MKIGPRGAGKLWREISVLCFMTAAGFVNPAIKYLHSSS